MHATSKTFHYTGTVPSLIEEAHVWSSTEKTKITFMVPIASIDEVSILLQVKNIPFILIGGGIRITHTWGSHTNDIVKAINALKANHYMAPDFATDICQNYPYGNGAIRNLNPSYPRDVEITLEGSLFDSATAEFIQILTSSQQTIDELLIFLIFPPPLFTMLPSVSETASATQKKSINETQKNIIEATLRFILDSIAELKPKDSIKALQAIISENTSTDEDKQFEEQGILECIKQARRILAHPYPQNRSTSYPYFGPPVDPTVVVYKDAHGQPAFEKKGLLSLTARNDDDTSITKKAVVDYVHQLVNAEIVKHQHKQKAVKQIQFWYRRTRDENKVLDMIENKESSLLAQKIQYRRG